MILVYIKTECHGRSKELNTAILRSEPARPCHSSCVFRTKVSSTYLMIPGYSGHTISLAAGLCLSYCCFIRNSDSLTCHLTISQRT
jgi:hypothetical protein